MDWLATLRDAAMPVLFSALVALLGWLGRAANKMAKDQTQLTAQHAILSQALRDVVGRIDALVVKLDQNFSIQINEQLLRNTLQEKVANLERQMSVVQRTAAANVAALSSLARRAKPEEDAE